MRWAWLGIVLGAVVVACAQGEVEFEEQGSTNATSGPGGAGPGTGGGTGSCSQDCSTIETPPCVKAVCNEGQYPGTVGECVVVPDANAPCEDGVFCTIEDACDDKGLCVGGPQNDCGMVPEACQEIVCNEDGQTCSGGPVPNGTTCTHPDLCMVATTCNNGLCTGIAKDCFFSPVPNDCHISVCNPMNGMCEAEVGNEGNPCTDPLELCTVDKTCSMGTCVGGSPKDCSMLTQGCFNGVCEPLNGQCVQQPVMQGDPCLDAADDCNNGICDMNGICQPVPTNQGGMCEDGNPCTAGETCNTGMCTGGTMVNQVIYFSDDFSDNSAGWTLDTEWQIGPTMVSSGQSSGFPDPALDNTSTTDNGVAGVVLGGNAATNLHPYYYLTSPPINVASVQGPLWFAFYRWLNSDYTPFMQNIIEVWNGSSWQQLWTTGGFPGVEDDAWTQMAFDITAHKNSALKIRIGFLVGSSGVYDIGQWNVDDFVIANVVCP